MKPSLNLSSVRVALLRILTIIIGKPSWEPPSWIRWTGLKVWMGAKSLCAHSNEYRKAQPRRFWTTCSVLLILGIAGWFAYDWYSKLPKPHTLDISITPPPATPLEKNAVIAPVVVRFSGSAAPLELVGKEVTENIRMTPPMAGSWRWASDSELVFTPKEDWAVGQLFTVTFRKRFFARHVLLDSYSVQFSSAPFVAELVSAKFYEDPVDPKIRKVVATATFSHQIDKGDFERRVRLKMRVEPKKTFTEADARALGLRIEFDEFAGQAFIHSEVLTIPDADGEVLVELLPGARAARGGPATDTTLSRTVHVPGSENYFRVLTVEGQIVRDRYQEPKRVVFIENSAKVSAKSLKDGTEVYLLPKDRPAIGDQPVREDYWWSDPLEIVPEVIAQARPLRVRWTPTEHEYEPLHSFQYDAEEGDTLFVRIKKGTTSYGDFKLGKEHGKIIRVVALPAEVTVLHEGSLMSLRGDKKITVRTRNLEAVRIEVDRILPGGVPHLLSQATSLFKAPYFSYGCSYENSSWCDDSSYYSFGLDNISEVFSEEVLLPPSAKKEPYYHAVDFTKYLAQEHVQPRGLFVLRVEGWNPQTKTALDQRDQRLVLLSDLGLIAKQAKDGSHNVFVQSFTAGNGVAGATVEVVGKNGLAVLQGVTDDSGHVAFPTLKDFKREKSPVAYIVKKESDLSFLPLNRYDRRLELSRFDIGGIQESDTPDALQAYLYSDRGIYRPGDTAYIALILKSLAWSPLPAGVPFEVAITDPRGSEIRQQIVKFGVEGFESISLPTTYESPSGTYDISLYLVRTEYGQQRRGPLIGSTTIRVEEFQPDRMTLRSSFNPAQTSGWLSPDSLQVEAVLRNLYGTPATSRTVKAQIRLVPTIPSFPGYSDLRFYDPLKSQKMIQEPLGELKTDDEGRVIFDLGLERFEAASYRIVVTTEGFEAESGRSVSSEVASIISPRPYFVGYKADGDLEYIRHKAKRVLTLQAVNPALEPTEIKDVSFEVVEVTYVSVLMKQENGTLAYQSVRKEIPRSTVARSIAKEGTAVELPTQTPGNFLYVVRAADGTELHKIPFSIMGAANVSRDVERNAELQIKLPQRDFNPGEMIELTITAPYTGSGLITIEREKVFTHTWFTSTTTSSVQSIVVPDNVEGNAYITVTFLRSLDSAEIYMSPLSYASVPFTVSRSRRTIPLIIDAPEKIEPGTTLSIGYSTDRPSRVALAVVDQGILQVARYKVPDPHGHLFRKRALEVSTIQMLDLLLPEYQIVQSLMASGGDEDSGLARHLNPFKRKGQKPVAYWSGLLDATSERRTFDVQIPSYFNGSVSIIAVSVAPDALGVATKATVVRGPVVLTPNAPYSAVPGDEFEVSVIVANQLEGSGKDVPVEVSLEPSPHFSVVEPRSMKLTLSEGKDAPARFRVRANEVLGSGSLTFSAAIQNRRARYSVDLSIRPAEPFVTTLASGHLESGLLRTGSTEIDLPRSLYPEHARQEISVSSVPLGIAPGVISLLDNYPHGCTEQITSRVFPQLVLTGYSDSPVTPEQFRTRFHDIMRALQARQNSQGGFGFWFPEGQSYDVVSLYALHFLLESRERGFEVPAALYDRALGYARGLTNGATINGTAEAIGRAYALYLVTRSGIVTTHELKQFVTILHQTYGVSWQGGLLDILIGSTYHLLHLRSDAEHSLKRTNFSKLGGLEVSDPFLSPLTQRGMTLYLLAKHFPDQIKRIGLTDLNLITDEVARQEFHTFSASWVILGLEAYTKVLGTTAPFAVEVVRQGAGTPDLPVQLHGELFRRAQVPHDTSKLQVTLQDGSHLFYQALTAGFDKKSSEESFARGIEVLREYRTESGELIQNVKPGDSIHVHLVLRSINEAVSNVAVVDLLPAGVELDLSPEAIGSRQSLQTGPDQWLPDYIDAREERVLFYGTVTPEVRRFVYRVRTIGKGTFVVPPLYAEAMYNRQIRSRSRGGVLPIN
jgi:alpha-2-macroglobulin